ncbi:MAG: hypothetical protein BWY85_01713 [Firmicutes bacterium ADurb.Bin506]|nr:MAG: hypothetical protein BWY85_01713 [Firmicutes bacterium ADurb.Bin506]
MTTGGGTYTPRGTFRFASAVCTEVANIGESASASPPLACASAMHTAAAEISRISTTTGVSLSVRLLMAIFFPPFLC